MEFDEVISTRKSIRSYSEEEIPEEILSEILNAGRLAPSFQNRQCWRFLIVRSAELRKKLALQSGMIGKINFFIKEAPVIIVACADPSQSGRLNQQDYYLVDTAIAFQQIMLAAWNYGIGSCWLAAFNENKVKNILNIPEKIKIVAMSPFGFPGKKESIYGKAVKAFAGSKNRKSLNEIVMWEKWT